MARRGKRASHVQPRGAASERIATGRMPAVFHQPVVPVVRANEPGITMRPGPAALPARLRAVRAGDLVDVTFRFVNLTLEKEGRRLVLRRKDAGRAARLVLVLPPQHITEGAYLETAQASSQTGEANATDLAGREGKAGPQPADEPLPGNRAAVPTLMGGPSQLVFDVAGADLDFTLAGLLEATRRLPLVVGGNAPAPRPLVVFATPAVDLTTDRARLRRAATALGTAAAATRKAGVAGLRAGTTEQLAQVRSNAMAIEHRFGREAAATWVVERLAGVIDKKVIDVSPLGPLPKRAAIPVDPFVAGVTGIEIPFRILLSPHAGGAFELRSSAPLAAGPTELWHARLGLRSSDSARPVDEAPSSRRTVRAVWARDRDVRNLGAPPPFTDPFERGAEPHHSMRLPLNTNDRLSIVHQSSDFSLRRGRKPFQPLAIPVDRLFVSTLGGWLDGGVNWPDQPDGFEVEEWRHLATLGRDHYVRIVRAGFLFPTGHRASLVKLSERRFHDRLEGNPAFLRQRFFIVVREPRRSIPSLGDAKQDRQNPFGDIRITTVVTPPLDPPESHEVAKADPNGPTFFQPRLHGQPFEFQGILTDVAGNLVEVSVPLLFLGKSGNDSASFVAKAVAAYDGATDAKAVPGDTFGQRIAFAPPAKSGDTEVAARTLRLAARVRKDNAGGPRFGPVVASADVAIPAVEQLTGQNGTVKATWPQPYLDAGIEGAGNGGQVFLELKNPARLDFAGKKDRSGGLVAPNIDIQGLSRAVGPIGVGVKDFAKGTLDPAVLFSTALSGANLFGVVPLAELIKAATTNAGEALAQAPKFLTEALTKAAGLHRDATELADALAGSGLAGAATVKVRDGAAAAAAHITAALKNPASGDPKVIADAIKVVLTNQVGMVAELAAVEFGLRRRVLGPLDRIVALGGDATALAGEVLDWVEGIAAIASIRTRVVWHPQVQNWGLGGDPIVIFADPARALTLAIDLANPPGSSSPLVDVSCSVEGVTVDLKVVELRVDLIRFTVRGGHKPDIEVQLGDPGVVFGGPLAFVEELRSLIPLDGFSDPPSIDVRPDGLTAGFSLALPNLAVGIFSLENLSLSAALEVPFVGESLSFRFAFCTRENPFHLIVSLFGGGGFVGIELTPKGIRMIEAALEFGAAVSLDFGVASGSLSVMAGIYFRYEVAKGVLVSGYFRARGEVDVLGLISASIELTISLTWQDPNKVAGRATLTIEVEVLFFSASVSISCEKRFAGSGSDPTFAEVMGPGPDGDDPWRDYCRAFVGV